jgi:hypothetical protein
LLRERTFIHQCALLEALDINPVLAVGLEQSVGEKL